MCICLWLTSVSSIHIRCVRCCRHSFDCSLSYRYIYLLPYFILSDFSFVSPFHFMCFFKLYVAQLIVPFYYLWKLHCIVKTMVPILNMIDLLGNLSFIFFTPRLRDTFGISVLDFFSFDTISQHQKFEYFMFFRY